MSLSGSFQGGTFLMEENPAPVDMVEISHDY